MDMTDFEQEFCIKCDNITCLNDRCQILDQKFRELRNKSYELLRQQPQIHIEQITCEYCSFSVKYSVVPNVRYLFIDDQYEAKNIIIHHERLMHNTIIKLLETCPYCKKLWDRCKCICQYCKGRIGKEECDCTETETEIDTLQQQRIANGNKK